MFDIDDAQTRTSNALKGKQVFRYPPSPRCLACEIQVYEEGTGGREGKGRDEEMDEQGREENAQKTYYT